MPIVQSALILSIGILERQIFDLLDVIRYCY